MKVSASLCVVLLALLPACAAPQTPASSTTDDVAQIRAFLGRIEQVFDAGDLDAAAAMFADDATIVNGGSVDAVGKDAIRALYAGALAATSLRVRFHTEEIVARGELAYERGTYDLEVTDKGTGRQVQAVTRRHVHILEKQPSGEWKTWRMFTESMAVEDGREHVIDEKWAKEFAQEWIDAWNAHDLNRILSHYTDDFEMRSPIIVERMGVASGLLKGKKAVSDYWEPALVAPSSLKFVLHDVLVGTNAITLYYYNVTRGRMVAEVLTFNDQRQVVSGSAHYSEPRQLD